MGRPRKEALPQPALPVLFQTSPPPASQAACVLAPPPPVLPTASRTPPLFFLLNALPAVCSAVPSNCAKRKFEERTSRASMRRARPGQGSQQQEQQQRVPPLALSCPPPDSASQHLMRSAGPVPGRRPHNQAAPRRHRQPWPQAPGRLPCMPASGASLAAPSPPTSPRHHPRLRRSAWPGRRSAAGRPRRPAPPARAGS